MTETNQSQTSSNSGRWTVAAMFGFAVLMIASLFLYWEFYTAPFRELQYAIAEAYPDSAPRVVGGEHKSHKNEHPMTLRVVVYVSDDEFDPEEEVEKSEARAKELAAIAFEHHAVGDYEQLQIVLLQKVPESARKRWTMMKPVAEWREML